MIFPFIFRISEFTTFVTADDKIDSSLQIMKIINHLYGDYICKVANNLGTVERTITVYGKYYFLNTCIKSYKF